MHKFFASALIVYVLICPQAAPAAIINFQFDGARSPNPAGPVFTGNGVLRESGAANENPNVGGPSGTWNAITFNSSLTPSQTSGFVDAQNHSVPTTITFANLIGQDSCSNCTDAQPGADVGLQPLLNSYLGTLTGDPAVTVTLGNLGAHALYDVYLYGTNGASGAGAFFSLPGATPQSTTGGPGTSPFTSYIYGQDYVEFTGVTTDGNGNLAITIGPSTITIGIVNGLQLELVPEPSSLRLLGLAGGAAVVALRRRHGQLRAAAHSRAT